ncbi:MAG: hypothetical protein GTO63_30125 [Anaerolineae bacterium]|nr:hypothetical protein [Anaerolineae bacterium]NIN98963.1 hypothetical protein [Anaerolineae bacterium]
MHAPNTNPPPDLCTQCSTDLSEVDEVIEEYGERFCSDTCVEEYEGETENGEED